jgi:TetR/AcrR family transcriptional regulator
MAKGDKHSRSPQDASTRDQILDAALQAFSLHGFDGASTRSIAAQAGVNQGLIPYYFGTKQTLWREAVDRAFESLHAAIGELAELPEEALDADVLARMIRRYVAFTAAHPEFSRMMNEEGKRDGPRMRWLVRKHVRPIFEALGTFFERIGSASSRLSGIDSIHLNYIFVGAAGAIFHQAPECRRVSGYDPMKPAAIDAHADALIELLLGDVRLGR